VGPRAGLDEVAKRKNLCPCRESNAGRPASSFVIVLTELSRLVTAKSFQFLAWVKYKAASVLLTEHLAMKAYWASGV
jgi:hypothetical protein